MKTRVTLLVSALCLAALSAAGASPDDPPVSCALVQPEYLSAVADNTVALEVRSPAVCAARLKLTLGSSDALVRATLFDGEIALCAGTSRFPLRVPASELARVNLYEDVTLSAAVELPGGRVLRDEADATVLPEAFAAAPSAWGLTFAAKPAQVYTSRSAPIALVAVNPKGTALSAKVQLAFKNSTGLNPVIMATNVSLAPGTNTITVTVPSSISIQAKTRGATTVKASLRISEAVKAKDTASVDYDLLASAAANPTAGDLPLDVDFSGSALGGQPPYSYLWDFGDGGSSSQQATAHTYLTEGTYHPALTVTDTLGGRAGASSTVTVSVPPLTAACSAQPLSGIGPLLVTFTGSASGGTGTYAFDWDFGDGSAHASAANTVHTYTTGGAYTALLTVTSGTQTKTCSQTVTVTQSSIVLSCGANPASGVAPLTVSFSVTATGGPSTYGYLWDFGDGTASTVQNPTHQYAIPGFYHAAVTVTSGGQTVQCQKDVAVSQLLAIGCDASIQSGVHPLQVNFTSWATGGIASYVFTWTFGDGATATGAYAIHTYTQAGMFTATITVQSGDQKKTCTQTITVS